jgi:hypothetical protein
LPQRDFRLGRLAGGRGLGSKALCMIFNALSGVEQSDCAWSPSDAAARSSQPDLREKTRLAQRCQHAGVDLVGLDPSMCKDPAPHTTAMALPAASMISLSPLLEVRPKPSQRDRDMSARPPAAAGRLPRTPSRQHSAGCPLRRCMLAPHLNCWKQWATRHLRIRAHSATGLLAGAASF